MIEHAADHGRVAVHRDALVPVPEVAVVTRDDHRDPSGDGPVDVLGPVPPLLHRVVQEDLLVDELAEGAQIRAPVLQQGQDGDPAVAADLLHQPSLESHGVGRREQGVQRRQVERQRHRGPLDATHDPVGVGPPVRELRQVRPDPGRDGVEDVRPVPVDPHPRLVHGVVGVPGDVRASVHHQDPLTHLAGDPLGQSGPAQARSDHHPVESHRLMSASGHGGLRWTVGHPPQSDGGGSGE